MIGMVNIQASQKVGIDLMALSWYTRHGLAVYGMDAHQPHKPGDMLPVYVIYILPVYLIPQASTAHPGMLDMKLIDDPA